MKPNRRKDATIQTLLPKEKKNLLFTMIYRDGQKVNSVLSNAAKYYVETGKIEKFFSEDPHSDEKEGKVGFQFKIETALKNQISSLIKGNGQFRVKVFSEMILFLIDHPDELREFYD